MNMTKLKEYSTKGYKVRLYPNRKQRKLLFEYFNMAKEVYNLTIDLQEEHSLKYLIDEERYPRLSYKTLNIKLTELKNTEDYKWLDKYNVDSIRGAIKDCCKAYNNYDKNEDKYNYPKYKNKSSDNQFYTRPDRMKIMDKCIKLSSIGNIKYCNSYGDEILGVGNIKSPNHLHYYNSRISFDGLNFYLSFTVIKDTKHQINSYKRFQGNEEWQNQEIYKNESIGIDVGLKNDKWMVDSTSRAVKRPNSDSLRKRIARYERKYQRQKDTNLKKNPNFFKYHPNGSKNMQKTLARINKDYKKISNRRHNVVHNYACDLIKLKPKTIVMESKLAQNFIRYNSSKGKSNKKVNQMIYDAALYETTMIIEQKAISNGINVIRADGQFPSSQICSCCGYRQNIGEKKIYKCPECGIEINRDLNAAINLANYEHIKDKYIQKDNKKVKITIKPNK